MFAYLAIAIDDEFCHYAQLAIHFKQRGCAGGKLFRQHWEVAHAGVNRACLLARMQVDRRAFGHKRIHIGYADQHLRCAVRQLFRVFNLVKIARGVIVDGRPQQFAQVLDICRGCLRRFAFDRGQLLRDSRREFRLKAILQHQLFCGCLEIEVRGIGIIHR